MYGFWCIRFTKTTLQNISNSLLTFQRQIKNIYFYSAMKIANGNIKILEWSSFSLRSIILEHSKVSLISQLDHCVNVASIRSCKPYFRRKFCFIFMINCGLLNTTTIPRYWTTLTGILYQKYALLLDLDYVSYYIHSYLGEKIYIVGDPPFIKRWPLSFRRGFWVSKIFPKIGASDLSHIKRGLI